MGLLDSYPRDSKRQLSIEEKLEAIRRVTDLGETKASVSRMYGVPESTLRGWCKNKDKLVYLSVNKRASEPKRKSDKKDPHYEGLLMPVRSPDTKKVKIDVDMNGFVDHRGELTPPAAHGSTVAAQIPQMPCDFHSLLQQYYEQQNRLIRQQQISEIPQINPDEPLSLVKKPHSRNTDSPPQPHHRPVKEDSDDDHIEEGAADSRYMEEASAENLQIRYIEEASAENLQIRYIEEASAENLQIRYIEDESALEAIGHGELFLKWLEGVSDPSITRLQLMQFRQLLDKVRTASFSRQIKST